MRTTPSRFSAYAVLNSAVTTGDRPYEGAPTVMRAPAWPPGDLSSIEQRHPAVVQALTLLWGRPEMNQYFDKIAGGRDASLDLHPEAMAEVLLLAALHRRICPYQPARSVEELYGKGQWADTWKPARQRG